MSTNGRRIAGIIAFSAVAALLWFALHRQAAAPRAASVVPSPAQSSSPELAPNPSSRKAAAPKIAAQVRAPDLPPHTLPEWNAPLEESVAELRKWSDAGDTEAQRQLTDRLELCTQHGLREAKEGDEIDRWNIERDVQNPRMTDETRAENRELFQSHLDRNARTREACAKLPKDLLDHWLDPADRAAQAGDVMAMLTYAKAALRDYDDVASVAANIDEVIERRDKARAYLEEAARRGDKRALILLAEIQADTRLVLSKSPLYAKDPAAAYAYAFVASRISDATPSERKNMEWLMSESAKRLDAQALARAQAEGERLYQQCCAGH